MFSWDILFLVYKELKTVLFVAFHL
jgi:hypothetical protein